MNNELKFHEAGHAVAAQFKGAEVVNIEVGSKHGHVQHNARPWDMPFITYAGLYAEARYMAGMFGMDFSTELVDRLWKMDKGKGSDGAKLNDYFSDVSSEGKRIELESWDLVLDELYSDIEALAVTL